MVRSGSVANGRLRARKGQQGKQDSDASSDDEGESIDSSKLNKRLMQILCVLQGFCVLGYGHYFKYHQDLDRVLVKDDLGVKRPHYEFSAAPELQPSGAYKVSDLSLPMFLAADTNGSLLYFYDDRCRHCKTLTPAYESAARELMRTRNFPLGMINLDAAPASAKRYSIRRVPTVMLFKNNKAIREMPRVRRVGEILEFVRDSMTPALVEFDSHLDFEQSLPKMRSILQPMSPPVIVGFQSAGAPRAVLELAAEQSRGKGVFLWVYGKINKADPFMKAYYPTEEKDIEYRGTASPKAIRSWVKGLLRNKK